VRWVENLFKRRQAELSEGQVPAVRIFELFDAFKEIIARRIECSRNA
jgi:hypothetical protein